jgi:hypothetical protein
VTANRPVRKPEPAVGQCVRCRFARTQLGAGSNHFWRCGRSDEDPEYPRYPRLPVVGCLGFEPEGSNG